MVTGESNYGEAHLGNVDVLNGGGQVIAIGKLSAMKFLDDDGSARWQGHLTAVAPPEAAQDLTGEFTLRMPDGNEVAAVIEFSHEGSSQISPGLEVAVTGVDAPTF
jgi:hypothetical protein